MPCTGRGASASRTLPPAWHPWPKGHPWGCSGARAWPRGCQAVPRAGPQRPPSLVGIQGACSRIQEAGKADLLSLIIISDAYHGSLQTWFN